MAVPIPSTYEALVLPELGKPLVLETHQTPKTVVSGSALVQILATTIRPHNREGFNGNSFLSFPTPFAPGTSAVGRILAVGDDAVTLRPGQLVMVYAVITARDDPQGTQFVLGLHDNFGEAKTSIVFKRWKGLWRSVAEVPMENCIPLNEKILVGDMGYSYGELEVIDRLSVAFGGVCAARLRAGKTVVVGPATGHYSGAVVEVAAQIGCRVIALTRSREKLEPLTRRYENVIPVELTRDVDADVRTIQELGFEVDAFIDVGPPGATAKTSSPHHFVVGMAVVRRHGDVVLMGGMGDVTVPYWSLMMRNIKVQGQFMLTREQVVELVKMIEAGVVKLGTSAGHEVVDGGFTLKDWERAVVVAETALGWGQQALFLP